MYGCLWRPEEGMLDLLGLQLQVAVSHLMWVLGTEFGSSARATTLSQLLSLPSNPLLAFKSLCPHCPQLSNSKDSDSSRSSLDSTKGTEPFLQAPGSHQQIWLPDTHKTKHFDILPLETLFFGGSHLPLPICRYVIRPSPLPISCFLDLVCSCWKLSPIVHLTAWSKPSSFLTYLPHH